MKSIQAFTAIAAIISMTACVKESLHETDHPGHGKIISLTTVWNDRGEGINIPTDYTVKIGDFSTAMQGATNTLSHLFTAGQHIINVYNEVENISINGTTATANYSNGLTGWLFAGTETVNMEEDKDCSVTVDMRQQVRQLTLVLNATGDARNRITGINATLSGIAASINIENGNPAGEPVTVTPVFTQVDGAYWATMRLIGVQGNMQTLSFTLHFTDGNPQSYTMTSDLSALLAAFNSDKKTPLILQSILTVTPTQTGVTSTVADWVQGEINTGTAK